MPLLDTRVNKDLMGTFIADLVLQILSFVAESERKSIKERQRQGIEAAKARGVKFGRPSIEIDDCYMYLYEEKTLSANDIANKYDINLSTFYRKLNKFRQTKIRTLE